MGCNSKQFGFREPVMTELRFTGMVDLRIYRAVELRDGGRGIAGRGDR